MGTMIHAANLPESDYDGKLGCSEILNLTRPEVIQGIHEAYYRAGSDVVETNSFGSSRIVLEDYGIADQARSLSRTAAQIARRETGKRLPVIVTVTVETTGTLLVGSTIETVVAALEPYGLFALGMNCATGPSDMVPQVARLASVWGGRLMIQPNAGLPQNVNGELKYNLPVADFVGVMESFVREHGVTIDGG